MSQNTFEKPTEVTDEMSIKDLHYHLKAYFGYLKKQSKIILIVMTLGGGLGLLYSILTKNIYIAPYTFVLEDSKSSGMGQYAGLASLAGINLGSSGGGIFEGDNIFELYKSRVMIEKTLLSRVSFDGRNQLLIERYIQINHLQEKWQKEDGVNINFNGNPQNFNRKQDSIISNLVYTINKESLSVIRPDKKLNIIAVESRFKDELFAKVFTETLVDNVNDFYIKTKTKKTAQNVNILQKQADSVRLVLNTSIGAVASALDAAPNANPLNMMLRVPSQRKQVDVQASTAVYGEIVKNLELAKITLRQETPLIQVLDKPVLPLPKQHTGKLKGIFAGLTLGGILSLLFLSIKRLYNNLLFR